jgi:hypothetical protein
MLSQNTFVHNISFIVESITDLTSNVSPKTTRVVANEKSTNNDYISSMETLKRKTNIVNPKTTSRVVNEKHIDLRYNRPILTIKRKKKKHESI